MVTQDSPGDRRLAHVTANAIAIMGEAIEGGPGSLLKRLSQLIRDSAAMPFLVALKQQAQAMIGEGKIKPGRLEAPDTNTAFAEVVEDLEKEVPDQHRQALLRRAFLAVAMGNEEDKDGTMGLIFVRIARRVTGEGATILGSAYKHRDDYADRSRDFIRESAWEAVAREETGILFRDLFREARVELMKLRLLSERHEDLHWRPGHGVLTDGGLAFCAFLERAEPFEKAEG